MFEKFKNKKSKIDNQVPTVETVNEVLKELQQQTFKPVLRLSIVDANPGIFESNFGGIPYIPHDSQLPRASQNVQMKLLAQINCEDIKDLESFPHQGILQFFISTDDISGLDFDNPTNQTGFKILYYKDIDKTVTDDEIQNKIDEVPTDCYFPIMGKYKISFSLENEGVSTGNFKFEHMFIEKYNKRFPNSNIEHAYDIDDKIYNTIFEETLGFGHKIGGYPAFTQEYPRSFKNNLADLDTLLLQIDSDFGNGIDKIMWGDSGVCNFFINETALQNCDFSNVAYNWDCY